MSEKEVIISYFSLEKLLARKLQIIITKVANNNDVAI